MTYRKGRKAVLTTVDLSTPAPPPAGRGPVKPDNRSSSEVLDHIGAGLRAIYDEVVRQPVPERFLKLLEALKKAEEEKK